VSIYGLRIIFDTYALEATTERLFPGIAPAPQAHPQEIKNSDRQRVSHAALHVAPSRYHLRASVAPSSARGSYARSTMSSLYIAERISA
jgi:hypothetical protein